MSTENPKRPPIEALEAAQTGDNSAYLIALVDAAPDLFAWIRLLESRSNQAVCSFCGTITVNDIEHLSAHVAACEKHPVRKLLLEKRSLEARLAVPLPEEVAKLVAELRVMRGDPLGFGIQPQVCDILADALTALALRNAELERIVTQCRLFAAEHGLLGDIQPIIDGSTGADQGDK